MPRTEACPVCGGEGRVYRMTPEYEATAAGSGGRSFSWTGPTHEWRTCRPCSGSGLLGGTLHVCAEAVAAERARIRAAVEGLAILDYSVVTYVDGGKGKPVPYMAEEDYYVKRAAVLRIIDGEDEG